MLYKRSLAVKCLAEFMPLGNARYYERRDRSVIVPVKHDELLIIQTGCFISDRLLLNAALKRYYELDRLLLSVALGLCR